MSDEDNSEDTGSRGRGSGGSAWTKVFWLFVLLGVAGLAVFGSFVWLGKQGIDSTKEVAIEVVRAFRPEQVVQSFEEWRELEATGTDGDILEIATAEATEQFTRQTNLEMFGTKLPLGTTVSEIVVPATYRYHIDLDEDWFLTSDGSTLLVLAPEVRPSLPVAFDTGRMRKKTNAGWARWDGAESLAALEKTLTSKLEKRARQEEVLDEVREEGRLAVAKFVRKWLLARTAWGEDRFDEIVIKFEGEDGPPLTSMPPTLRWESGDAARDGERQADTAETLP